MPEKTQQKKLVIWIALAVVILLIGIVAGIIVYNQNRKSNDKDSKPQDTEEVRDNDQDDAQKSSQDLDQEIDIPDEIDPPLLDAPGSL